MTGIGSQSPNWREALTAKDSVTSNSTYVTSTNNKLDVNATATISGSSIPVSGATTAIVTAIVDGSGNQVTSFGGGGGSGTSANLYTNQVTVSTSQVQLSSTSHALSNGIIVKSSSNNSASIYVGLTGVTTSTGDIIEPGEARGYAVNNTNLLYIISAASTTDIVSYSAN